MILENITKEHIEKAIQEIEDKGVRKGRHSSTYDLIYEGKKYPPKLVISIANKYANGIELEGNNFQGGQGTAAFELLEKEGFEIIQKNDPIKPLIEKYKKRIAKTQLQDEIYKWELVNHYNGRPNTEAIDFYQEIKDIKFNNLVYAMGIAVIHLLAKEKPEELRQLFIHLFDETKDLGERVKSFNQDTLKIYRELGETLQHHQDERSIASYLTFYNSEKYTFYKSSFYKKYCKLIGIKEAKKNEKYIHYLKLVDDLIENYIIPDLELIEQVKALLPEYYNGNNHKLLAQDILFQMLDNNTDTSYWVFQGNPKLFDFETALKQEILTDWIVSAHKDGIKIGDKVIIWITGNNSGCYALAEVISEPHIKTSSPDDHLWKGDSKGELKADIKITHNLVGTPIFKEQVIELNELKVGHQGTNFTATKEEYETILDIALSNDSSSYSKVKKGLDPKKFSEFISFLRIYVVKNKLDANDERISFNLRPSKNRLVFIIGNRYALCIEKIKNNTEISFISKDIHSKEYGSFSNQKKEIEAYWNKLDNIVEFEENIIEGFNIELNRNNKSPFRRFTNQDFINDIFQPDIKMDNKTISTLKSLNTILYGPPGTGKTYKLKNELFDMFTTTQSTISLHEFLVKKTENLSWWEVIALAVLDLGKTKVPNIFNHQLVKIKADSSNSTTVTPTIWGQLQSHTIDDCEYVNVKKRSQIQIFNKNKNSEWEIIQSKVEEQIPELLILKNEIDSFKPIKVSKKRYVFTTFHQSFSYEDFIEGIKPIIYEDEQNPEIGKQVIYDIKPGIFKQIVKEANQDRENDYAIFIDEINRGNIANIFGELITLIEDDKRIDTENYIPAKLPYSNDEFGVPPNLYIIGTMNTADRSVEALDTALRRRFSFIEMNPEPIKLSYPEFKCDGIDLEALLTAINARIEKLLDKDYCIGHSYFMTIKNRKQPLEELKIIFQNKILPLLQEYFYGDWGKIMLVIGKKFIDKKIETIKFLSNGLADEYEEYDEKPIYNFTDSKGWTIESFKSIYE
ncbi:MAG: EVE domain-containing protein [Bacteroidetes bacterium]|nr:EVE domain-containing protein [Bacteroidota bacterium]